MVILRPIDSLFASIYCMSVIKKKKEYFFISPLEYDSIVWQIEGDIFSVKKALIAVSGRLQDCPLVDKTRMTGSRPLEAVPYETLPDLHLDHLSQRNSMLTSLPSSSMSYASGVRPSSIEAERIPTLETKMVQQEVTFKILCANDRVGGVIGKGGAIVRALQNETGAAISIGPPVAECDERLITVAASEVCHSIFFPFFLYPSIQAYLLVISFLMLASSSIES